jgi:hypothetical protein
MKKEKFLSVAGNTSAGIKNNPDFVNAPVTSLDFDLAYNLMVEAAPLAMRNNIDGMRKFKPLRETVEGMITKLGNFAQSTIGDKPSRMIASGLPLTKEPVARPNNINEEVQRPRVEPGPTAGKINVSTRPNRAADGIVIEERQPDNTYKEVARVLGFKTTINGYSHDDVVVLQICNWNNLGAGPRMGRPLTIVV